MKNKQEYIDWCFKHIDSHIDKYELGKLVWDYLMLENTKLANKLARLEKLLKQFELSDVRPTPKKRTK